MANRVFRNNKNGHVYELVHLAVECTNSRATSLNAGTMQPSVAVYKQSGSNKPTIFVRDLKEFYEKFTEI